MTPAPSDCPAFEEALSELERILRNLEEDTTSLEESLAQYERGVSLLKSCYLRLRDAEQRIVKVTGVDVEGKPLLEPFEHSAALDVSRAAEIKRTTRSKSKENEDSSY